MTNTLQLNLRVPVDLKVEAQKKAEKLWTNINFLVKMFLSKFVKEENLVIMQQDIKMEKIFDKWFKEYFMSNKWKNTAKKINKELEKIIEEEKKYIV